MRRSDDALSQMLLAIEADRRGLFARLGDFAVEDEMGSQDAIPSREAADV